MTYTEVWDYKFEKIPSHPRANSNGYVIQHVLFAERALGKPLPSGAVVHHHDRDTSNNTNNLVICPDQAYHLVIHSRMRALEACGNANWKHCIYCKQYDDEKNMNMRYPARQKSPNFYHVDCHRIAHRSWRETGSTKNAQYPGRSK